MTHLYKKGAKYKEEKMFEHRYGKKKGDYVYGAVVGKVKREREALAMRNRKRIDKHYF